MFPASSYLPRHSPDFSSSLLEVETGSGFWAGTSSTDLMVLLVRTMRGLPGLTSLLTGTLQASQSALGEEGHPWERKDIQVPILGALTSE